ncbi:MULTISPECIES: hypothetical protein [unclassified Flavobacterium]|uniref:hypothetical protein n=1 Tax=unclassified Flavobacterium TaxID=196869 RepID=UPI0013D2705A|nr:MULTISPECIES: hypothetical protein [unclassified Flavobacterium]MBA5793908.1 hypothetical protein [Flavobacterium sp. xlx-221]
MEEKNVKKISLRLYKVQTQLEALNDEKLKPIIKEIEAIDKDLLKENNVKFPIKMKQEILDFL